MVYNSIVPVPKCDTARVVITVTSTDITAVDDTTMTPANTPVNVPVMDNDIPGLVGLNPNSVDTIPGSGPTNGTVMINANGTIDYTPDPNFAGMDTFMYVVCDSIVPDPNCDTATVFITATSPDIMAGEATKMRPANTPVNVPDMGNDITGLGGLNSNRRCTKPSRGPHKRDVKIISNGMRDY